MIAIHFKETPAHSALDSHQYPGAAICQLRCRERLNSRPVTARHSCCGPATSCSPRTIPAPATNGGLIDDQPWRRAYVVLKPGARGSFRGQIGRLSRPRVATQIAALAGRDVKAFGVAGVGASRQMTLTSRPTLTGCKGLRHRRSAAGCSPRKPPGRSYRARWCRECEERVAVRVEEIKRARAERVADAARHIMRQIGPALQHLVGGVQSGHSARRGDMDVTTPAKALAADADAIAQSLAVRRARR